ncbi:1-acyl-sn-glycerol-3-phosphate acyltransferase [Nocardia brasiliensis]|uniref:1-acyl-sn-glycerol-3-phosphate acyltransferase n=1 Tax=Nocardia brasiliensis TaxID=37326 RepID=UPI001EEB9544|nr:1-acyl-sn-glycerol-3-phosphate acyltransferase [Nocardia brasiliensis]
MKVPGLPTDRIDRLAEWVAHQVKARVPAPDPADRDPEFIIDTVGPAWLFARTYFRAEVRGLELIPDKGPILLVGNHSGGNVSPEVLVTTLAFVRRFGPQRPFFQLAHDLVMAYPVLGALLRRFGTVSADPDSARRALRDGAAVLVYPGGDWEVHRPTWEEDRIDFAAGPASSDWPGTQAFPSSPSSMAGRSRPR